MTAGAAAGARPDAAERGSGTVLALALVAAALVLALALAALGAAQRGRGTAQAAADLGALAAATAWRHGLDPCAVAAEAVRRNGAGMAACRPEDRGAVRVDATVTVVGPAPASGSGWGAARAAARAGPRP